MKPNIIVLCGGNGTRFAPLVTNKLLWPFFGTPFIMHLIADLKASGFKSITAVCSREIQAYINTQPELADVTTIIQDSPLGMDDALQSAASKLKFDSYLVINGDDILNPQIWSNVTNDIEPHTQSHVVAMYQEKYQPFGYYVEKNGKIVDVIEKPPADKKPSNFLRLTVDYFANIHTFIAKFDKIVKSDARYEDAMAAMFRETPASFTSYSDYWAKLKYPHNVLEMTHIFLNHRLKPRIAANAVISPLSQIEGDVIIEAGVKIDAFARIIGPAYIGPGTIVGSHTLVRNSIVENDCVVGFGSEVARSYIGPKCLLHHTYIGDSILENSINMGWGSVTSNVKFDKRTVNYNLPSGARITSNSKKFGSVIATGSFVGSGANLMPGSVVPPNSKVMPNSVYK